MAGERGDIAHPRSTGASHEDPDPRTFAGGEIRSEPGGVDAWLLFVYAVLAVWGVYYLLRYWGGLGPGLAR